MEVRNPPVQAIWRVGFPGNVSLTYLVGGFNPVEKYARQIGSSPQVGMKIENV